MQKYQQGTRQERKEKISNELGKKAWKKSSKEVGKVVCKKSSKEDGKKV